MIADDAADAFRKEYGAEPAGLWAAPGRVNLIGEHTDYTGGFVLPLAIPQRTRVALARRQDSVVRAWSANMGGQAAEEYRRGGEKPGEGRLG